MNRNQKENKSIYYNLGVVVIIGLLFFHISYLKDKLSSKNENIRAVHFELAEYKQQVLLNNQEVIASYIKGIFGDIKEYRVITLKSLENGNHSFDVIVNEPQKNVDGRTGYSTDNVYTIEAVLTAKDFELISLHKSLANQVQQQEQSILKIVWDNAFYAIKFLYPPLTDFEESVKSAIEFINDNSIMVENPIILNKF